MFWELGYGPWGGARRGVHGGRMMAVRGGERAVGARLVARLVARSGAVKDSGGEGGEGRRQGARGERRAVGRFLGLGRDETAAEKA